jgi:hypothetical protein
VLVGRHPTTPPLFFFFALVIFQIEIFAQGQASDQNPPTYASCIAGIIDTLHHALLAYWDSVPLTFAWAGLEPRSSCRSFLIIFLWYWGLNPKPCAC